MGKVRFDLIFTNSFLPVFDIYIVIFILLAALLILNIILIPLFLAPLI